jgi:hypothetical protein
MMFLSERRRLELIESLTALSMSRETARLCASQSDDIARLDRILGDIVGRLGERVQATLRGSEDDRPLHDAFLRADLAIYSAYQSEIFDRKLPARMFPRTTRAVEESREELEASRQTILEYMGKRPEQALQ